MTSSGPQVQAYFKEYTDWSLVSFLRFRKDADNFTGDKAVEHFNYKTTLEKIILSDDLNRAKVLECLVNFEDEKSSQLVNNFWTSITIESVKLLDYSLYALNKTIYEKKEIHAIITDDTVTNIKRQYKSDNKNNSKRLRSGDMSSNANKYEKAVTGIYEVQEKDETLSNPLCWGVIDFREEKVHPWSNLNASSSTLLEALQSGGVLSIQELSKEKRVRGMEGIQNLLKNNIDDINLQNLNIYDDDTQYIGECLDVTGEAEKALFRVLETINSKNDIHAATTKRVLNNFNNFISSSNVEQFWSSIRV
nr:7802_t:CDS:2 [Entrophospora candida]